MQQNMVHVLTRLITKETLAHVNNLSSLIFSAIKITPLIANRVKMYTYLGTSVSRSRHMENHPLPEPYASHIAGLNRGHFIIPQLPTQSIGSVNWLTLLLK